jgi:hypothetical protein
MSSVPLASRTDLDRCETAIKAWDMRMGVW